MTTYLLLINYNYNSPANYFASPTQINDQIN